MTGSSGAWAPAGRVSNRAPVKCSAGGGCLGPFIVSLHFLSRQGLRVLGPRSGRADNGKSVRRCWRPYMSWCDAGLARQVLGCWWVGCLGLLLIPTLFSLPSSFPPHSGTADPHGGVGRSYMLQTDFAAFGGGDISSGLLLATSLGVVVGWGYSWSLGASFLLSVGLWWRWCGGYMRLGRKLGTTTMDIVSLLEGVIFYLLLLLCWICRWKPSLVELACRCSWRRFLLEGFARLSSFPLLISCRLLVVLGALRVAVLSA
jgi:hypothetical protein